MSASRQRAAELFSILLEIPQISHLVQRGRDPEQARYTLVFADGRAVRIGTIKILWSQAEMGKVLAVTLGCVPLSVDAKDWRNAIRAIIVHCTDVEETPDETFEATVADWVRAYANRTATSRDREGAAPSGEPFLEEGKLFITANSLAKFIRRDYSEQIKLYELRSALRDIGFQQETVHWRRATAGRAKSKSSSTSYYSVDQDTIDGEEQT
jgi:hypothetical protein